jgi:CRISPR-associated endonuclease/helicase Cas3
MNTAGETPAYSDLFEALTGHTPMRWQCRLFDEVKSGRVRPSCDLPTGLGKTSVIPIWLIALASQASEGRVKLPRRLVYIVNRRTVVDQATGVVERMRAQLLEPDHADWRDHAAQLHWLRERLRMLRCHRCNSTCGQHPARRTGGQ